MVGAAQKAVDELQTFVLEKQLVNLPAAEKVNVAPAREFDLGLASMHASPPLEVTPVKSYYYITDAQAAWSAQQQDEWLKKFNYSTLAVITSHEVMPGHYVHSVFMRKTPGKVRRIWIGLNPFPQPSSGQDGWAHYAEQMMVDEGFRSSDPRYEMAQISESLTRICRLIWGFVCTPVSGRSIGPRRSSKRRRTCQGRPPGRRRSAARMTRPTEVTSSASSLRSSSAPTIRRQRAGRSA